MTRSRYEEILIGPKNQGKSKVNPSHNMFKAVVQPRHPTLRSAVLAFSLQLHPLDDQDGEDAD